MGGAKESISVVLWLDLIVADSTPLGQSCNGSHYLLSRLIPFENSQTCMLWQHRGSRIGVGNQESSPSEEVDVPPQMVYCLRTAARRKVRNSDDERTFSQKVI